MPRPQPLEPDLGNGDLIRESTERSKDLWLATFEVHNGGAGYILKHTLRAKTEDKASKRVYRFVREFYLGDGRPVEESWRPAMAYERKDGSEYIELKQVERVDAASLVEAMLI